MNMTMRTSAIAMAISALALSGPVLSNPAAAAQARAIPTCAGADLSAKQTDTAAGMSQPTSFITVTNASGHSCVLNGYPTITSASTKKRAVPISVGKGGPMMNGPTLKPKRIVLADGGNAYFVVGGVTALDPPVISLVSITFATSSDGSTAKSRLTLWTSRPAGEPFSLQASAFAPGVGKA